MNLIKLTIVKEKTCEYVGPLYLNAEYIISYFPLGVCDYGTYVFTLGSPDKNSSMGYYFVSETPGEISTLINRGVKCE